jgi:drug/metabolite transporter (DMT)-like permease
MNKGIWLTALSAVLYGSIGYFGIKLANHGLLVRDFLLWRFLFSSILLVPLLPFLLPKGPSRGQTLTPLTWLFVLGAVFYGGGTALYYESSLLIGTGLAMVIFFVYPIFVVIFSYLFDQMPLRKITLLSVALIVLGCSLIALEGSAESNVMGLALAFLSAISYGVYVFWSKKSSRSLTPALATFAVCSGASVGFVGYSLLSQGSIYLPAGFEIWTLIALFALVGTILPVLLLLAGMKTISANKASIISVLEPVTTLAVGALVLGEAVSSLQFLGALIILSSAIIIQLEKDKAATPC